MEEREQNGGWVGIGIGRDGSGGENVKATKNQRAPGSYLLCCLASRRVGPLPPLALSAEAPSRGPRRRERRSEEPRSLELSSGGLGGMVAAAPAAVAVVEGIQPPEGGAAGRAVMFEAAAEAGVALTGAAAWVLLDGAAPLPLFAVALLFLF